MHFTALCKGDSFTELLTGNGHSSRRKRLILRTMRLSAFLLLVGCMQVSARGYSQISISENNTSLEKIFGIIERQSGYVFFYDYAWLKDARPVSLA